MVRKLLCSSTNRRYENRPLEGFRKQQSNSAVGRGHPPPALSIRLTATNTVAVVWPSPSTDFQLQQATNGCASGAWSHVTSGIQDDGFTKSLIVDPQTGTRFYRLFQPFLASGSIISVTPTVLDVLPDNTHLNLSGCNKMATNFFNVMMAHSP